MAKCTSGSSEHQMPQMKMFTIMAVPRWNNESNDDDKKKSKNKKVTYELRATLDLRDFLSSNRGEIHLDKNTLQLFRPLIEKQNSCYNKNDGDDDDDDGGDDYRSLGDEYLDANSLSESFTEENIVAADVYCKVTDDLDKKSNEMSNITVSNDNDGE